VADQHREAIMMKRSRILAPATLMLVLTCALAPGANAQVTSIAQLLSRAAQPWLPTYNPKTSWDFTHSRPAVQQVCRRSESLPIPRADLPTAAQLPQLARCNSEALYYGFDGKPNDVQARDCAYLERALGDRMPLSGSAVLSMIYANGLGVRRNVPLAIKFACEAGGAPAEINGRIQHLQRLAAWQRPPWPHFDFCDDVTSGFMTGVCAAAAEGILEHRRKITIERIASRYSPTQKAAFLALQYIAQTYFNVQSQEEVDFSGSAGRAFVIDDLVWHEHMFTRDIEALNARRVPVAPVGAQQRADARLEALYQRVLANPALRPAPPNPLVPGVPMTWLGTISREGLRVDQALWLSYRDAWVHFAAVVQPGLTRSRVSTWITRQRIDGLRCQLPYPAARPASCNIPWLSPTHLPY
jgi:hypothetical protein